MFKLWRFIKQYSHHKFYVFIYIMEFASRLIWRALVHDLSKLKADERRDFIELASIDHAKNVVYGSDEYKAILEKHRGAIDIHYSRNSHHDKFHKDGVHDMSLYDLIEMVCDWRAAGVRNKGGSLAQSFEVNKHRYSIPSDLYKALERTFLNE